MMDFPKLNELKRVAQAAINGGDEEDSEFAATFSPEAVFGLLNELVDRTHECKDLEMEILNIKYP